MIQARKISIAVGVLFIIGTVSGVFSAGVLVPVLDVQNDLSNVASAGNEVILGVFLLMVMSVALIAIAVVIFPILKKQSEAIAVGYVAARILEVTPFIIGIFVLLAFSKVSQDFVSAGAPAGSMFLGLAGSLNAIFNWTAVIGGQIIFSLTAVVLNYSFFKSRIVPRWISVWGLLGAPLMLASGVIDVAGFEASQVITIGFVVPLALNEMVLAIWLIVKGFNLPAESPAP
ncbi:MAG: DUF4386 domain-containing protein [Alphaproteobacteria bacterium]|jgi:hypothetical protein|nr:DUF4386 domain-containing protein [Alphaproteobacteria bacterium]MBT5859579.1 DUF4386 domain-containing protein [Alphaproteobacteria bacterium]